MFTRRTLQNPESVDVRAVEWLLYLSVHVALFISYKYGEIRKNMTCWTLNYDRCVGGY